MKITKTLTAMAAAAALAATMTVTASAATYKDCVEAAEEAGVQSWNVEQLEGFLDDTGMSLEEMTDEEMNEEVERLIDVTGSSNVDPVDDEIERRLAEIEGKKAAIKE